MLLITPSEINELLDIISTHHSLFILTNVGGEYLSKEEISKLEALGVNTESWLESRGTVEQAHVFGLLAGAISDERAKDMNYKEFKKWVQSKNYIPLTSAEKSSIEHLKYKMFSDVKNLEQRVRTDITRTVLNSDQEYRANYENIIRDAAIKTVEKRGNVKDIISEIGHRTENWNRDLGRIAETVLHEAYEEGRAAQFERQSGKDVLVYKDVYSQACSHCIKHYLTAGLGSEPRVFKLSELKANGSNVGKKQADWKPVLGFMHPFCRCSISLYLPNTIWDKEKKRYVRSGNRDSLPEKVRNRQKVKVIIGDKEYLV